MIETIRELVADHKWMACVPFLSVKNHLSDKAFNTIEIIKALITAGIIGGIVSYGTIRVLEKSIDTIQKNQEQFYQETKASLAELTRKLDADILATQSIISERAIRKPEIDRRLDALEKRR